jgi:hypothetical protein
MPQTIDDLIRRIKAAHEHYLRFFEYGDAESWQKRLERLRRHYPKEDFSVTQEVS